MIDLTCPKCRSDNTQKLSLAVEGGTFSNKAITIGAGVANTGAGLGAGSTKGTSTSRLAQRHEAPEKIPVIRGGLSILIVAWVVSLLAGPWAMTVGYLIAVAGAGWGWVYNFRFYPTEMAEWDAKYLCLRCSEVFKPQASQLTADQSVSFAGAV